MTKSLTYAAHPLDRTARLPVELLWNIMDSMSLAQLLRVAHVCQRWRVAAFEHNKFRTDIRLYQVTPIAIQLFLAQLERSRESRITFDIRVSNAGPVWSQIVIPALNKCLGRVIHLTLWIDVTLATLPFTALLQPAPHLETFSLRITRDSMIVRANRDRQWWEIGATTIPLEIFGSVPPPYLHTFRGQGVRFPNQIVPAFSQVQHVLLYGDSPRRSPAMALRHMAPWAPVVSGSLWTIPGLQPTPFSFGALAHNTGAPPGLPPMPPLGNGSAGGRSLPFSPTATTACFPRMKTLSLHGHTLEYIPASPSSTFRQEDRGKLQLERLTLDLELTCYLTLTTQVEANEMKSIRLVDGSPRAVTNCIRHITGPTHLRMLQIPAQDSTGRSFVVDAIDFETGRIRTFEEYYSTYLDGELAHGRLNNLLLPPSLCARIVTLTISQTIWSRLAVAVWIPVLPAVERLVFVIDVEDIHTPLHPLSTLLNLPALKHLALATVFETRHVRACDVAAIVGQCLYDPPQTLSIWVCEGVILRGTFDPRNVIHVGELPRFELETE